MCNFSQALLLFSKLKHGWELCALDSFGLSRGLLSGWNPLLVRCKDFSSFASILLKFSIKGLEYVFLIINCYGPYSHHIDFWNNVFAGGLFSLPNLLLTGDLNFTLTSSKFWGTC